jgi:hypothetical protein
LITFNIVELGILAVLLSSLSIIFSMVFINRWINLDVYKLGNVVIFTIAIFLFVALIYAIYLGA